MEKDQLFNPYYNEFIQLKKQFLTIWGDYSFFLLSVNQRTKKWALLDKKYDSLKKKYSWVCPDEQSLKVLQSFSPLIEIGGGKGYWAKCVQERGGIVSVFDKYGKSPQAIKGSESIEYMNNINSSFEKKKKKKDIKRKPLRKTIYDSIHFWTDVLQGGPHVLLESEYEGTNLFLCYPDEEESIAIKCLESFQGTYILHVGELMFGDGTLGEYPQAPFGRTSSAEFQAILSAKFHCLLVHPLELRLPFSRDCLTVWKRTVFVTGRVLSPSANTTLPNQSIVDSSYASFNQQYFSDLYEQEKMLADKVRMAFYKNIISTVLPRHSVVLDVGTGTGILAALVAKFSAPKVVYAIDHSPEMVNLAKRIGKANQLTGIEYYEMHSSEFGFGSDESIQSVDVILHEQMGDYLFDEEMIENICDLRDRILTPKTGIILPNLFELFIEPVQINDHRHVGFISDMNVYGIDFSSLNDDCTTYQDRGYYHFRSSDPSLVDHMLIQPQEAIYSFDLQTIPSPSHLPSSLHTTRTITHSGRCDGLAVYFKAKTPSSPPSKTTFELCTGPHDPSRASHWGNRILRTRSEVYKVGERMEITVTVEKWSDLNTWRWNLSKVLEEKPSDGMGCKRGVHTEKDYSLLDYVSMSELQRLRQSSSDGDGSEIPTKKKKKKQHLMKEKKLPEMLGGEMSGEGVGEGEEKRMILGKNEMRFIPSDPIDGSDEIDQLREAALDCQYYESNNKKWAQIPTEEQIQSFRMAPCMSYLFTK